MYFKTQTIEVREILSNYVLQKTRQGIPEILSNYFENKTQGVPEIILNYSKNKTQGIHEILSNYF